MKFSNGRDVKDVENVEDVEDVEDEDAEDVDHVEDVEDVEDGMWKTVRGGPRRRRQGRRTSRT
jgi:hypothetical protein